MNVLSTTLKDGTYRLVVQAGKVAALSEGGLNSVFMTLEQMAQEFPPSYWWFSRNWDATLRLPVYSLDKKSKLFKRAEVYAAIERTRVLPSRPVGRAKKTVGVLS